MADLSACPQSIAFLSRRLQPVGEKEMRPVRDLLQDLDSDTFANRQKARKQLADLGAEWLPLFYRALASKPLVDVDQSIRKLLESGKWQAYSPDMLRRLRALAVLEWQGTPEAKRLLQLLAQGEPDMDLTLEAKSALKRLRGGRSVPRRAPQ
jgi:hypothetical protein